MATGNDLRRLALALEGTSEHLHFDRAAFNVAHIYVTLAADGRSANFKFTPDEQKKLIAGASAPKLVSRGMLKQMKRGAVLVDVSINQGGCFATSKPTTHANPTFEVDGIILPEHAKALRVFLLRRYAQPRVVHKGRELCTSELARIVCERACVLARRRSRSSGLLLTKVAGV